MQPEPAAGRWQATGGDLVLMESRRLEFVFPGRRMDRPLSNMAFLAVLKRMGRPDLTAHGFRSSFRDWAAERTDHSRDVVEMAPAHSIGDKVEAAYRRGTCSRSGPCSWRSGPGIASREQWKGSNTRRRCP